MTEAEWASGTIQWSNKPAANVLLQSNISHNNVTGYVFSCLAAVQHWYDGDTTGQNENYGIMLRYYNESIADYNAVYSADYSDATKRPSLTIYYQPVTNEINMLVNKNRTLSVDDYEGTITWTSADPTVATVNSSGVVTSIKVGSTTVTAYGGGNELKTFKIYVKIQDGVYYIKNTSLGLYLGTGGGVTEQTGTSVYARATAELAKLKQIWKIAYLGSGYYSIRPMYALSMGLHATSNFVDIVTVGTIDSLAGVMPLCRWGIESTSGGYVFAHVGTGSMTMRAYESVSESSSGYYVSTGNYSSGTTGCQWTLEMVTSVNTQVLLLDSVNGTNAANRTVYLDPGQTMTLADLQIMASAVCMYSINQNITWNSNSDSVKVNSTTGAITAMTPGKSAVISAKYYYNGTSYQASFYASVKPVPDGNYYLRSQIYNRYLQIDNDDASNNYSTSGAIMEQWEFDGGDYQKWTLQWRGNGYYSIISAKSGKALTVPSGQIESADVSLVQQPYTGSDRQLWKITITDDHYYKIKAKSSEGASNDLVMAVGDSLINDSNGVNIEQRLYLNRDDEYYDHLDKWFICSFVDIGMSTDNYSAGGTRERQSYLYATTFWDDLNDGNPFSLNHRYNMGEVTTASKADFSVNGAISNNIDFMIYVGHGHSSGNCSNSAKGNHIQYSHAANGLEEYSDVCISDDYTQGTKDMFCLYTDDVKFGSSTSDLRWVWMYTCNFLNINDNATETQLTEMMNGAHILMGYGTQSKLCKPNVELFAKHLRNGETIIDSFFWAGQFGEATCTTDNHLQRVMYIPQAEFETIYSPQIHYDYEPEDVIVRQRYIKEGVTVEN